MGGEQNSKISQNNPYFMQELSNFDFEMLGCWPEPFLVGRKTPSFSVDHGSVKDFSAKVLKWWAKNRNLFSEWAKAARIVFSFTPNSAAAERVFSFLKAMFTDEQTQSLADLIQSALMLKYNGRKVG